MNTYKKILDSIEVVIKWLAIAAFSVMVISSLLQVFSRYVINASISWTDELSRYTFIWTSILGACLVFRKRNHVMVELFIERLGKKGQGIMHIIIDIMSAFALAVLLVYGIKLLSIGAMQITPALRVRMDTVMLIVPISAAFMLLTAIEQLFTDIGGLINAGKVADLK